MASRVRYMYLRDEHRSPIGCVAIQLHRKKGYLEYQVSVVNPVDRVDRNTGKSVPFNRNVARDLALGRLVSQGMIVPMGYTDNMNEITHAVMSDVARQPAPVYPGEIPNRAIRAAKLWLKNNRTITVVPEVLQ